MRKIKPCSVCGKMTARFLFNDRNLGIAVCSKRCEYEYISTLAPNAREQTSVLRFLDGKIEETKRREKIGWTLAGLGLLIVAFGFFMADVVFFVGGIFPLTGGALSTSHFEDMRNKLIRIRKRIAI